jgi:hypothetical protein
MTTFVRLTRLAVLVLATAAAQAATAQTIANWTAGNGPWNTPTNWSTGNLPDTTFDEQANISNGGTATLNAVVAAQPGQIVLGSATAETGSLVIGNGGEMTVSVTPGNITNGAVNVGQAGTGHLTVQPGGSLSARTLTSGGGTGSSITLGAAAGAATTVNIEFGTTLNRQTRVIGPNVNFSTLSLTLQGQSQLTAQITGATHSPLKSANPVTLGGTLRVEFTGVTPAVGNTWNLFDSTSFTGAFASIDASAAPALPFGQVYAFRAVESAGSVNGSFGQLTVEQQLVLNVNRGTGAMSINNGPSPVSIDGYAIKSALGALRPANWTSLQDQAVSDWRESPPGGATTQIAELKPTGSTAFTAATPRNLGNVFQYPAATEFGTELEDIQFEYYAPDGSIKQGQVNYIGDKRYNNLVLTVDPATGAARMENQSNLSVNIDGYQITSASGSLLPANGSWNSLDDQNAAGGDWRESNSNANQLVELKPTTSAQITGGTSFNMGTLFKTAAAGGAADLAFGYVFPGDTAFRTGVVVYRSLTTSLPADFNDDGVVNGADLTVWRNAHGTNANGDADGDGDSDGNDFLLWQRTLGSGGATGAAGAVPEPGAAVLALLGACPFLAALRRNYST